MDVEDLINQLEETGETIFSLLTSWSEMDPKWKMAPEKWSLLEIVGHLCDEEVLDFRTRVQVSLDNPNEPPPAIDPVSWVDDHNYLGHDFVKRCDEFRIAREESINWLRTKVDGDWDQKSTVVGHEDRSALFYLSNWVAHDLLHIKQITRLRYDYLDSKLDNQIKYAGNWV